MTSPTDKNTVSRRTAIRTTLAAGGLWAAGNFAASTALTARSEDSTPIPKGSAILFQGDSITDAGRNKKSAAANDTGALGRGYPLLLAARFLAERPGDGLKIFNRGISGHKVPDLDARWQRDTIDLSPALVSILIGVNDIWHKLGGRYDGTVADYEKGYAALLERTKKALPKARIVVLEPFVLRCGAVTDKWFPEFDERRQAAKRVSDAAGTTWIPMQTVFDEAAKVAPPAHWARDGVHPSVAGHGLIAKTWWETVVS